MIISYEGKAPKIARSAFIAPTAVIIGDVHISDGVSIWYGVVIRGDMERVIVGEDTNIQDNCTVHTDHGYPSIIGPRVSVGHNAVIHGCEIEADCLIGIGAIILSGSRIGSGSLVAAGSLVSEGQKVGSGELVAGTPARLKRELTNADIRRFAATVQNYKTLSHEHAKLFAED